MNLVHLFDALSHPMGHVPQDLGEKTLSSARLPPLWPVSMIFTLFFMLQISTVLVPLSKHMHPLFTLPLIPPHLESPAGYSDDNDLVLVIHYVVPSLIHLANS
jgi:hypothetical protein